MTCTQCAKGLYLLSFPVFDAKWSNLSIKCCKSWSIYYRLCRLLHCLVLETWLGHKGSKERTDTQTHEQETWDLVGHVALVEQPQLG